MRPTETEAGLRGRYYSVLDGKRALILLDDAGEAAQVTPLLPPAGCLLIITARPHLAVSGLRALKLDALPPADAPTLLLTIEPRIGAHAQTIAELCGRLPLALRAAASLLLVTPDLDPALYAEQLRDERTRLETIGAEGVDASVEASFNLSYARLLATHPEAARVFRVLAVFPADFDAAAEEAICDDPQHKHLSLLVRWSLVDYALATERYRLHDLVRVFANARMSDEERFAFHLQQASYYEQILLTANMICLKFAEKPGDRRAQAVTLMNIGNAHAKSAEYELAIGAYQAALQGAQAVGDKRIQAQVSRNR